MSVVTNIIVLTEVDQDEPINRINQWLPHALKEISMRAGGNKAMEADVWAGAYNHLDVAEFKIQFENAMRLCPEWGRVQLLIKEEHEGKFSLLDFCP